MKHVVAIVDGNAQHRAMVSEALLSFYTVHQYGIAADAISNMLISAPKLILVGERVGAGSGANFIRDLRKEKLFGDVPVIFIVDSEDFRIVDKMRDLGIKDHLVKPYHRSTLINTISKYLNSRVERSWQELPTVQRKALEGTLSAFNSIADDIANGNPLPYGAINDSCVDLVEAVSKGELGVLLGKIKDHDNFTFVHSLRFATLMSLFAGTIGLPKSQQVLVASGGLLHDVGKMTIPRALLNKQGKLTPSEWKIMHSHVSTSEKFLTMADTIPKGVFTIVSHHHERLDGSGYPRGLSSSELNELSRMAAIIDVFCALTDRRPYKRTVQAHVALETMATEMQRHLDQDLLYKFRDILLDTATLDEGENKVA
jgi:putative nucleotidyltransferase with HDIG domain